MKNQVCARWGVARNPPDGDAVLVELEDDSNFIDVYVERVYPKIAEAIQCKFKQEDIEELAVGFADWVTDTLNGKFAGARYRSLWTRCEGRWIELYILPER